MNPLNDDELQSLLQQAKSRAPAPPPELTARALGRYRRAMARRTISIPVPLALLAAVLLLAIGLAAGLSLRRPARDIPAAREHALTFQEFQPVRQIQPRVVRSISDDRH